MSQMRYDASKKRFEYRVDEKAPAMVVPEASIASLTRSIRTGGGAMMAAVFEFLVQTAKTSPGRWAEASSQSAEHVSAADSVSAAPSGSL
jgi:hypothetical protein